jgi:NAD(P)-dependent dehydrogenase (short-subunit alcohol dehydrogenase family)
MEIKNCAAIITGGASGLGRATANHLSKLGAAVTLLDTNIELAKQVAADIQGLAIACDITAALSVEKALIEAAKQHGAARICINCAGIVQSRRMVNLAGPMPLDEFRQVIEVNLLGTFNVMRLATAAMMPLAPQGPSAERGIIINTASIAGYEGQIGQTAYSASKGGIISLTLPAARELAQFSIRVMAIAPGIVDTPMLAKIPSPAREALTNAVPFPSRQARPEEYAQLVQHIIENAMLNGTVIRLDGALRL